MCDILRFLDNFISRTIEIPNGKKVTILKIYQCPKCFAKNRSDGEFQQPINFISHLLHTLCFDWLDYVPGEEKILFDDIKDVKSYLESICADLRMEINK